MSPPGTGFQLMRDAVLSLAAEHAWASALINPRQSSAHVQTIRRSSCQTPFRATPA